MNDCASGIRGGAVDGESRLLAGDKGSRAEEQMCLFEGTGERIRPVSVVVSSRSTGPGGNERQERTSEEVAELFGIAAQENDAIERLTQCAENLRAVQDAKVALARLPDTELRAALRRRHLVLVQPGSGSASRAHRGDAWAYSQEQ